MTKKSAGRLARDAAKAALPNTSAWDDVLTINRECHRLLASHGQLSTLIQMPEIVQAIQDKSAFTKNVYILANDLGALTNELQGLAALHADKTGRASTPDEHLEAINVYEKYVLFIERHNAVVMPTATHLAEQVQDAVDRVARAKSGALSPEQDPNVITDVPVRAAEEVAPQVH